jgi:hypothetical protein
MIMEPFVLEGFNTCATEAFPDRWDQFKAEVPLRAAAAKRIAEKIMRGRSRIAAEKGDANASIFS